jgi:hypothetical protein
VTIGFPVVAHQHGIGFTDADMSAFAETFLKNVYRDEGRFKLWIGRDRYDPEASGGDAAPLRMTSILGWIVLDKAAPQVRDVVESIMLNRRDLFPHGWLMDWKSTELYAYRMVKTAGRVKAASATFSQTPIRPGAPEGAVSGSAA